MPDLVFLKKHTKYFRINYHFIGIVGFFYRTTLYLSLEFKLEIMRRLFGYYKWYKIYIKT